MSRLYPSWGSGTRPFEGTFVANSMACTDREDLETGDKVILPQSTLKDISRLRLPLPIMFEVFNPRLSGSGNNSTKTNARSSGPRRPAGRQPAVGRPSVHGAATRRQTRPNAGAKGGGAMVIGQQRKSNTKGQGGDASSDASDKPRQFCGVIEFSAPENVMFMPFWMMQNLRIKEGSQVRLKSVFAASVPKGIACKLQPHSLEFLDVAATMDLRELFEECFRNYSGLSAGETIVISVFGTKFKINVLETTPAGPLISLYGTVDLEVDFAAPLDSPAMGRIRPSQSKAQLPNHSSNADPTLPLNQSDGQSTGGNNNTASSALQRAGGASLLDGGQIVIDAASFMGASAKIEGTAASGPAIRNDALAEAVLAASRQRNPSKFAKRAPTLTSSVFQGAGRSLTSSQEDGSLHSGGVMANTSSNTGTAVEKANLSAMDTLGPGRKLTDSSADDLTNGSDKSEKATATTVTATAAELRRRRMEFYASVAA
jgi:hypothetical protein